MVLALMAIGVGSVALVRGQRDGAKLAKTEEVQQSQPREAAGSKYVQETIIAVLGLAVALFGIVPYRECFRTNERVQCLVHVNLLVLDAARSRDTAKSLEAQALFRSMLPEIVGGG